MELAFLYCLKCGRIYRNFLDEENKCDVCGTAMSRIPEGYNMGFDVDQDIWNVEKERLMKEQVETSPIFDKELFDTKGDILSEYRQKYHEIERAYEERKACIPKCPTCSSTNIKKISSAARLANAAAFGFLGNRRNKQFHCNNCKYEW